MSWLWQALVDLLPTLTWAALALGGAALLYALAAPLLALFWWSGWLGETSPPVVVPAEKSPGRRYLVYLSGMGDISGSYSTKYEDRMLAMIARRLPETVIVPDIFAFSVRNLGLTDDPRLGWWWRWVNRRRLGRGPLRGVGNLVFFHNILQIGVSADPRYGPLYNHSVAQAIYDGLLRRGYEPGSGAPLTLLAYSGGSQIALATSGYLKRTLRAPVQVITLGGVFNSTRSLLLIDRLVHVYGSRDGWVRAGEIVFPARWRLFRHSVWQRALGRGTVEPVCIGPLVHSGRGGYLDGSTYLPDGRSYLEATVAVVVERMVSLEQGPYAPQRAQRTQSSDGF